MFNPGNRLIKSMVALAAPLVGLLSLDASAHNLQTRMAYMYLDEATQACIDARIANTPVPDGCQALSPAWTPGTPVLAQDDELGIITKVVPDPSGTTTGVGGHIDFYVPNGVQVVDVAYMVPDGNGNLVKAQMKGQSPIAVGAGPIGAKATAALATLGGTYTNVNGVIDSPVVAGTGVHRGTIAGVYGDTGIFFSEDPDTAWGTWQDYVGNTAKRNSCGSKAYDLTLPDGGQTITNNSGDTVVPCNKWDAGQLFAWGAKATTCTLAQGCTAAPIVDSGDGRGNAPWGFASGVAGPESGYKWYFDWNYWRDNGRNDAAMREAMAPSKVGPWQRIQYDGSRVSYDQAGSASTVLGQASLDASKLGVPVSPLNPLTETTSQTTSQGGPKAIRYAVGQLTQNRPEYVWVKVKIKNLQAGPGNFLDETGCPVFRGDTFGGDAGGTDNGKDHLWRYYEPTVFKLNGCLAAAKPAEVEFAKVGDIVEYQVKAYNLGTQTLRNVTISDTLPSGLQYLGASPAPNAGSNPLSWSVGNWGPGDTFEATLTVKILSTGQLSNCLTISGTDSNNQPVTQNSCDITVTTPTPYLVQEKTANPTSIAPGAPVSYTLTVKNVGTGPTASPLTLTDALPSGFTYSALPTPTATVNGSSVTPTVTATNTAQPVFSLPAAINPGQAAVLTFTATTSLNLAPGSYCNTYTATQNGIPLISGSLACVTVAGGQIGDTIFRDWNGNGVQDPGEEGLPNVTVTLSGAASKTATTDADGKYLFSGLAAGSYTVTVSGAPSGYTLTADPDANTALSPSYSFALAENQKLLTVDFGYQPGGSASIGDQVFEDKNLDGRFDGTDVGIPNVQVVLYEDTNANGIKDDGDNQAGTTFTDPSGIYHFTGLDPARSYLVVVLDGKESGVDSHFDSTYQSTTTNPRAVSSATLLAAPGNTVSTVDFGYYGQTPSSIGDTVCIDTNKDGLCGAGDTGLPNITLTLYEDVDGNGTLDDGEPILETTATDGNGRYRFGNLPAGDYLVAVDGQDTDLPAGYLPPKSMLPVALNVAEDLDETDFPFVKALDKTVDQASSAAGQTLTYTLTPRYPGDDVLATIGVYDEIPTGTTYVDGSANQNAEASDDSDPADGSIDSLNWDLGANIAGTVGAKGGSTAPAACTDITTTVIASRDTYISSGNPTRNYGISPTLSVSAGNYGLLYFPITSATLPANAVISNIALRMNVTTATGGANTDIRKALTPWAEGNQNNKDCVVAVGGATWNLSDCKTPGTKWLTASGANFGSSDYAATSLGNLSAGTTGLKTLSSANLTALVKDWLANGTNDGLVMLTANANVAWSSRETTTPGLEPAIVITYTANGCTVARTIQETGAGEAPDTWVDGANPTRNNGTNVNLVTKTSGSQQSSLVKFDLSSIPAGTVIDSATLGLVVTNKQTHTDTLYAMTTAWAEGTVSNANCNTTDGGATWQKADCKTSGGSNWTGSTFSSGDYDSLHPLGTISTATNGLKTVSGSALKTLVQDWITGTKDNKGFALVGTSADTKAPKYASGEFATTASRPRLTVTWKVPANGATGLNTITASPSLVQHGDTVKVTMVLTNTGGTDVDNVSPDTLLVGGTNGASASCGVASPLSANVPNSGSATFTWTCTASVPADSNGSLIFSAGAGNDTDTWDAASSNSVIVARPLTFQVTVNSPAGVDAVTNAGTLNAGQVSVVSNIVDTRLSGGLGDRVWVDLDGDGVQDAGEPGLAGVRAYIDTNNDGVLNWTDTNANGVWDTGEGEHWVATDGSGIYHIYGLAAGTYNVRIDPTSYTAGYMPSTPALQSVTLSAGTPYLDTADFGLIPPGTGSIGDTIWLDSDNNGSRDAGEAGLPNITVKLYRDLTGNGYTADDILMGTQQTDADGKYLFSNLAASSNGTPITYLVMVDEANSNFSLQHPYSGQTETFNLAGALDQTTSNTPVRSVTLSVATPNVETADFGYNWSGSIGDTVFYDTDADGTQDAGEGGAEAVTLVLVWDENGNGEADLGEPGITATSTAADGSYLFDHLPPGTYLVEVAGQTVESPTQEGVYGTMVPTASYGEYYAVNLSAGQEFDAADFGFAERTRIAGHVFNDPNLNGIFDDGDSNGIQLVTVYLKDGDGNDVPGVLPFTTTTGGSYQFLVPPGTYRVSYETTDPQLPSNSKPTTVLSYLVTAAPGQEVKDLDFGVNVNASSADLAITKDDGKTTVDAGGTTTYTIVVTNNGPSEVTGARVTDTAPAGLTFESWFCAATAGTVGTVTTACGDASGTGNINQVVNLQVGGKVTYSVSAKVAGTAHGALTNRASVSPPQGTTDADPDNNNAADIDTIRPVADLAITKTDGKTTVGAGGTTTYTIVVTNNGPSEVTGAQVTDTAPAGLTFGSWTCAVTTPGSAGTVTTACGTASGTGNINQTVTLRVDGQLTYMVNATVGLSAPGTILNTATIAVPDGTFDTDEGNNSASDEDSILNMIGDRVWHDTDQDGIQDPDEPGIAGVTVELYNEAGTSRLDETQTDGSGAYAFRDLLPGTYQVKFIAPSGYDFTQRNQTGALTTLADSFDSDADPNTGEVVVTVAGNDSTIDAGLYLTNGDKPARIGDRVWFDTNKNGVQEPGEPGIAGITVHLYGSDGSTPIASTTTDGQGRYEFTGLPAGDYLIKVISPAGYSFSPADKGGNDAIDSDIVAVVGGIGSTDPISLAAGEDRATIDAGLYLTNNDAPATISDRVWYDAGSGTPANDGNGLQDAGEPGIPGARVNLYDDQGGLIASVRTDAQGKYAFTGLPAGDYQVEFELPVGYDGFSPQGSGSATDSDPDPVTGIAQVSLVAGQVLTDIDAGMFVTNLDPIEIGDYVWLDANDNLSPDNSEWLDKVDVVLYDALGFELARLATDKDFFTPQRPQANYLFTGVAQGDYRVAIDTSTLPSGVTQVADPDATFNHETGCSI